MAAPNDIDRDDERRRALAALERVKREPDVLGTHVPPTDRPDEAPDRVETYATWIGRGLAIAFLAYMIYVVATSFGG